MAIVIPWTSRTFDEYLLIPGKTTPDHTSDNISLRTPLVKFKKGEDSELFLNLPFTSAIMQAVSWPRLAVALALEWGLSFIFQSQSIENQTWMVTEAKNHKAGFVISKANLMPNQRLSDIIALKEKTGHSTIAITDDGTPNGKLLWVVTGRDWRDSMSMDTKVEEIMTPFSKLIVGNMNLWLPEANDHIFRYKLNSMPIVDGNKNLKYFVFRKDAESHREHKNEVIDDKKRILVGAGINTHDYKKRVAALVDAGADILCIDSSDGYSSYQSDVIEYVRERYGNTVKIGAGNVVDKKAFSYLADAGADFIKVGIGGGSICITREEKWIGRGQATAVMEVAKMRDTYYKEKWIYVPICSDGGIVYDRHMTTALAMGADFLMMWRYFSQFDESEGRKVQDKNGHPAKEYWGEGSDRARNWQRYDGGEWAKQWLKFQEWVEGTVPYAGRLADTLAVTVVKIKSTMMSCWVNTLPDLYRNARITLVSEHSLKEWWAHDITVKS